MFHVLFENSWLLLGILLALEFSLIALWSWRRSRATGRAVRIGFIIAVSAMLLSHFVVTPREHLINLCHNMASYVDLGDVGALRGYLAEDFEASGMDRSAFVDHVRGVLMRVHVDEPMLWGFETEFADAETGVVTFHATARIRSDEMIRDRVVGRWRFQCRRSGDIWRVTGLEALPARANGALDLRRLLR